MHFMECQSCRGIVQTNNTGICLGCQRGFIGVPQEDNYQVIEEKKKEEAKSLKELEARKKEIEDALQKPSTEKIHVRQHAKNGERMGEGDAKKRKTPKKKGKK